MQSRNSAPFCLQEFAFAVQSLPFRAIVAFRRRVHALSFRIRHGFASWCEGCAALLLSPQKRRGEK